MSIHRSNKHFHCTYFCIIFKIYLLHRKLLHVENSKHRL
jgi:hypothetical protein